MPNMLLVLKHTYNKLNNGKSFYSNLYLGTN